MNEDGRFTILYEISRVSLGGITPDMTMQDERLRIANEEAQRLGYLDDNDRRLRELEMQKRGLSARAMNDATEERTISRVKEWFARARAKRPTIDEHASGKLTIEMHADEDNREPEDKTDEQHFVNIYVVEELGPESL